MNQMSCVDVAKGMASRVVNAHGAAWARCSQAVPRVCVQHKAGVMYSGTHSAVRKTHARRGTGDAATAVLPSTFSTVTSFWLQNPAILLC